MATYYVSTTGSNAAAGSLAAPFLTISHAAGLVNSGDVVRVLPGTYNETVTVTRGGTAGNRVQFISDTTWGAKMVASGGGFLPRRTDDTIPTSGGAYVDIIGFEFQCGYAACETDCSFTRFIGNKVHDGATFHSYTAPWPTSSSQTNYYPTTGTVVDRNLFYNIPDATSYLTGNAGAAHGIYLEGEQEIISNNLVFRAQGWGIHSFHTCNRITIVNNVCIENGVGGIVVGGGAATEYPTNAPIKKNDQSFVANNICRHNGYGSAITPAGGISESGNTGPNNTYVNNLLYQNLPNDTVGPLIGGTVSGTLSADPLFVNYQTDASGNYHLKPASPARDAGTYQSAPTTDYDGVARPQSSAYDIGAFEYLSEGWNLVQHNTASTGTAATSFTITLGSAVTVGNRLTLQANAWRPGTPNATISAVSDNLGNVWRNTGSLRLTDADAGDHTLWDAVVSTAGSITVTATISGGSSGINQVTLFLQEFSGLTRAVATYTDGSASATGTAANAASGASSPTAKGTGELALGYVADSGRNDSTLVAGSGWTQIDRVVSNAFPEGIVEMRASSSGSGSNASFTSATAAWAAMVVVFQSALGSITTGPPSSRRRPRPSVYNSRWLLAPVQISRGLVVRGVVRRPLRALRASTRLYRTSVAGAQAPGVRPTQVRRSTPQPPPRHRRLRSLVIQGVVGAAAPSGLAAYDSTAVYDNLSVYDSGGSQPSGSAIYGSGTYGTAAYAGAGADTTPPTVPAGLSATPVSSSQINLSWSASSDAVGVSGYTVYRNGFAIASPAGTSYSDTGLSPSTTYTYQVDAFDAAGNFSAKSSPVNGVTQAGADTQAPSIPTGLSASASGSSRIDLNWSGSSDNVGVTGYSIRRNGSLLNTSAIPNYSDLTVLPLTSYSYTVDAFDAAGNHSAQSASAAATTLAPATTASGWARLAHISIVRN